MSLSRRQFLARSGATGVAVALAGSADLLFTTSAAQATPSGEAAGYGPLIPDPRGLLDLPAGFSYKIVSVGTLAATSPLYGAIAARTTDPAIFSGSRLRDGTPVPGRFDGQATFPGGGLTRIVRNHEQGTRGTKPVTTPDFSYDPAAFGGTTNVEADRLGNQIRAYVSLAGTVNNCAGGRTPWKTWLTCEETESRAGSSGYTKDHGWVFEVDPTDQDRNRNPVPLTAMGRFPHEAVAVDPRTKVAYLTEDAARPFGLLYRFTPRSTAPGGTAATGTAGHWRRCTPWGPLGRPLHRPAGGSPVPRPVGPGPRPARRQHVHPQAVQPPRVRRERRGRPGQDRRGRRDPEPEARGRLVG